MHNDFNTEQQMLIEQLSIIDDLEVWSFYAKHLEKEVKKLSMSLPDVCG